MITTNSAERTRDFCYESINRQTEGMVCYIPTETWVLIDHQKCYDEAFVEANNLPVIQFGNGGGCMVAFPGNLEVGHFSKDLENTYGKEVERRVVDFLTTKGLNVTVDNNDVLVDGTYKVFSFARAQYNWLMFTGLHFSVTCDADLVDKVCTKPM